MTIPPKDINTYFAWSRPEDPAAISLWPYIAGHLIGRTTRLRHYTASFYCLHLIVKGAGILETHGQQSHLKPGDMFILWPGVEIKYFADSDESWELFWFHLTGVDTAKFVRSCGFGESALCLQASKPHEALHVFKTLHTLLQRQAPLDEYETLSILYRLPQYCRPNQTTNQPSNKLTEALAVIDAMLSQGINVNELRDVLKIGRTTLFRLFKENLHISPIDYIDSKRLETAKSLLKDTGHPVDSVAHMCGYSSGKYFMRHFKEKIGLTPTAYRKNSLMR